MSFLVPPSPNLLSPLVPSGSPCWLSCSFRTKKIKLPRPPIKPQMKRLLKHIFQAWKRWVERMKNRKEENLAFRVCHTFAPPALLLLFVWSALFDFWSLFDEPLFAVLLFPLSLPRAPALRCDQSRFSAFC